MMYASIYSVDAFPLLRSKFTLVRLYCSLMCFLNFLPICIKYILYVFLDSCSLCLRSIFLSLKQSTSLHVMSELMILVSVCSDVPRATLGDLNCSIRLFASMQHESHRSHPVAFRNNQKPANGNQWLSANSLIVKIETDSHTIKAFRAISNSRSKTLLSRGPVAISRQFSCVTCLFRCNSISENLSFYYVITSTTLSATYQLIFVPRPKLTTTTSTDTNAPHPKPAFPLKPFQDITRPCTFGPSLELYQQLGRSRGSRRGAFWRTVLVSQEAWYVVHSPCTHPPIFIHAKPLVCISVDIPNADHCPLRRSETRSRHLHGKLFWISLKA